MNLILILHSAKQNIILQDYHQPFCNYLLKMGRIDKEQVVSEQSTWLHHNVDQQKLQNKNIVRVVFWSLLLIFELIQQAALMNFRLYLNILKILKIFMLNISKEKLHLFPFKLLK